MAHILVVDDDQDTVRLVQIRLERAGHSVLGVSSPQKALEMVLEGEFPVVVVLHVCMPELSGLQLLQTLRLGFGLNKLPAVFLSGRVEPEEIKAGQALGATYLTKPFVASALLKAIESALKPTPHT